MIGGLRAAVLLVRRSLRHHVLSTVVTMVSTAFAAGLVMSVFGITAHSRDAFAGGPIGFDAVLGARGSALQLVLNAVYHLETSPGNLPWSLYEEVRADPRVTLAIPYAVGDSWRGHRVVGTEATLFTEFEYEEGARYEIAAPGRPFDAGRREAVIGALVAERTGLALGAHFRPSHGVVSRHGGADDHDPLAHDEEYLLVGVMRPTNTPADRVIWIPIEGVFRMEGHVLGGSGAEYAAQPGIAIPDEHKEVSAVMLKLRGPQAGMALARAINRGTLGDGNASLAWPIGQALAELFDKLGWVNRVLELVAYLVLVVAAGSILASLHNTMNERRGEFALLRALGASRRTVFGTVLLESTTVAAAGALLGFAVYAAVFLVVAGVLRERTGVQLELAHFHVALVWTPLAVVALGTGAGMLPAARAYATDVAENL